MSPLLDQWLASLADADLVVDPDDLVAEATGNLCWFGLTRDEARGVTEDDLVAFVLAATELRRGHLTAAGAAPMLAYWWHDEPSAQLRCSMVSVAHDAIPLEQDVTKAETPLEVVRAWLAGARLAGLPWPDPDRPPVGAATWESTDQQAPLATLAWVVPLP